MPNTAINAYVANQSSQLKTVNFTATEIANGWSDYLDSVRNAARLYGFANTTVWTAEITGKEAYLKAFADAGIRNDIVNVSVDGSEYALVPYNSGNSEYTLFSGGQDRKHFVSVRYGTIFSNSAYVLTSGNSLRVVGQRPQLRTPDTWLRLEGANTLTSVAFTANTVNYVPANKINTGSQSQKNIPAIRFTGDVSELWVAHSSVASGISDGANQYDIETAIQTSGPRVTRHPVAAGTKTYNAWSAQSTILSVGVFGTVSALSSPKRLDQFGDSITAATLVQNEPLVDLYKAAAYFGYCPGNHGVSGNGTQNLDARMDVCLAAKTITSSDVAIIAIGRNDPATMTAPIIAAYNSIIAKCLAKGYGKVLCRGVLPLSDGTVWNNTSIQSIVTAYADARVVYVDPSGIGAYSTVDGTHPDGAGHETIYQYLKNTAYVPFL